MTKLNRTTLLGAALAVTGALLLALFVARAGGARAAAEPTVPALVVAEALAPGMTVDDVRGRVRESAVPASLAPARRVADLADVKGLAVLRPVGEGEMLTADQFAEPGPVAGGLVVPAGYEALAVEADPAPGVEGYVTPGARVNVYATLPAGPAPEAVAGGTPESPQTVTQLVLGHLDVLAVTKGTLTGESRPVDGQAADTRVVLLLAVRPVDAPVLVHAQTQGALWFSLVNADDPPPPVRRVQAADLEPLVRTAEVQAARAQQDASEVKR
jgi:pilus assembly protein CpaB